ncbi:MAG TPA: HrpB1 family type III secretion system apparatus protein [Trinickia sp.]|nr:HrpB1 family type III secretion system apparatus protein [Trinickia sp.]
MLKDRPQCPPAVVGAVVELVRAAFARAGTPSSVETDDIELVVESLHTMRPTCAEFAFFDGWLHMLREEWSEAEWVYRGLVERSICAPASSGMLLHCLKKRGESGWQAEASTLAEQCGDKDVAKLAKVLLASDDLQRAAVTAKRTGRFVAPESALEFETAAQPEDGDVVAAPSHATSDILFAMQYMRI